ncbi:MAG: carbohydrate ABC transporter permease [Chloroflexi bacterium]|nr:carbohydrate ABC transporter permease [Chloroflexota bacterium]
MSRTNTSNPLLNTLIYTILIIFLLLTIAPFYWTVVSSLKEPAELFSPRPSLIPQKPILDNYFHLLKTTELSRWMLNSGVVAAGSTLLGIFFSSLAGYAFSKYRFAGRDFLFWVVLSSVSIPQLVTIIPMFALMARIGWLNTFQALIIPGAANAFGIFLMRQYIDSVPDELLDASRIDGCSEFQIYWQVILPVVRPALGALAIFLWLTSWNSYLWPLVMLHTSDMYTMPLGLATLYANPWNIEYGPLMAGSILSILPIMIIFIAMQKQFIVGLTQGAVKG